jgi:hypothetical protein
MRVCGQKIGHGIENYYNHDYKYVPLFSPYCVKSDTYFAIM